MKFSIINIDKLTLKIKNYKTIILFIIIIILVFIIYSSINAPIISRDSHENPAAVSQYANSLIGNINQNINVNEVAKYTWVNEKTWKSEIQDPPTNEIPIGRYSLDIILAANNKILPNELCIRFDTDAQIETISNSGVHQYISSIDNGNCFRQPDRTQIEKILFYTKPSRLEVKIFEP